MPIMRESDKYPIALCCADLHLSDKPPVARAGEKEWFGCMEKILDFIDDIAAIKNIPIICAGDIFHKPCVSPELELFTMNKLCRWRCIPGQHDLPNHNIELIEKASYGILCYDSIVNFLKGDTYKENNIFFTPFPFGTELNPLSIKKKTKVIYAAVIHHLIWEKEPPFPGAPESGNVKEIVKQLKGYDVIIAGDNHKGFVTEVDGVKIINCGSTMRRNADQIDYQPCVHLLYSDKSVESIPIPIEDDIISIDHIQKQKDRDKRIEAFVESLRDDMEVSLSFERNLIQYLNENEVDAGVKKLFTDVMGIE